MAYARKKCRMAELLCFAYVYLLKRGAGKQGMAPLGNTPTAAHAPAASGCVHTARQVYRHQPAECRKPFLPMYRPEAQRKWLHHCLRTLHKVRKGRWEQPEAGSLGIRYMWLDGQASWESTPAGLIQRPGSALECLSTWHTELRRRVCVRMAHGMAAMTPCCCTAVPALPCPGLPGPEEGQGVRGA